ncbi:conserved Plasmodium protein, unknown function [Plasmodium ovale curtisi]|uniref:Uncharacterized protein n=1 Tax=Plasmodium ovale curtisi TaxID=864141 RepID=A0A1A8WR96_PLAOA|nr:conserved Plasmodium protein, unknown function [Plasmodium ovale curtisi]
MTNQDNLCRIGRRKKHPLEGECMIGDDASIPLMSFYNEERANKKNKTKIKAYPLSVKGLEENKNIFKNSDIVCNILPFFPFSERWKRKYLSKSFYKAFNTKYAWTNVDFRFLDVDIFNRNCFGKYNKLFFNTFSLSLSINGKETVGETLHFVMKHFLHLKDLRLYFRKKDANFIYEGVHPVVASLLNCPGGGGDAYASDAANAADTSNTTDITNVGKAYVGERRLSGSSCRGHPQCTDEQFQFDGHLMENYNDKYVGNDEESRVSKKTSESFQSHLQIMESKKIWTSTSLEVPNSFNKLERLILDVELKGDDLLTFVGKLNNLKDIIISKLVYSTMLNRSQSITIFTCFIEKMKRNNIRLIQLGLHFRYEDKPIDYINNEQFRKMLNERKSYICDSNKEEGDELIYVLQKNHLNSLYCLWSNDLFISYEMYEQIRKFNNLKVWILPGWRALSLAKE